ncbi:MAG: hypothetical protein H7123_09745 [Thermoleophilia bacterium]|nr:hypothetical protein [Thermoleophilia bacterium]
MAPLITTVHDGAAPQQPTLSIIFNERSAPDQVADLISRAHAFVEFASYETVDEQGRPAFLLVVFCETATADDLFDLIGSRLPDYIQSRRFPSSRIPAVRAAAAEAAVAATSTSDQASVAAGAAAAEAAAAADVEAAKPPQSAAPIVPGPVTPSSIGIVLTRPGTQSQFAS